MATEQATITGQRSPPKYEVLYDPNGPDSHMHEHYESAGTYGIMHASDHDWSNVKCTAEAYGDARRNWSGEPPYRRSLLFHTEWLDVGTAIECLKVLEGACPDTFDPNQVIEVLQRFDGDGTQVVVGRECSPVIYVWTPATRTLGRQLNELDKPPEYGAEVFPDAETFPNLCTGDPIDEIGFGEQALLRAWWD